jgi:hypothetical protein
MWRWRPISFRPSQNASSRLTLVLWPATTIERLSTGDFIGAPPLCRNPQHPNTKFVPLLWSPERFQECCKNTQYRLSANSSSGASIGRSAAVRLTAKNGSARLDTGLQVHVLKGSTARGIDEAFAAIGPERPDALFVGSALLDDALVFSFAAAMRSTVVICSNIYCTRVQLRFLAARLAAGRETALARVISTPTLWEETVRLITVLAAGAAMELRRDPPPFAWVGWQVDLSLERGTQPLNRWETYERQTTLEWRL